MSRHFGRWVGRCRTGQSEKDWATWSGWADSNCRSPAPKAGALPLGHTPTPRRCRVIRRRAATSCSRRRPGSVEQVPPRRFELRSLAPEASTLSTELQGHRFEMWTLSNIPPVSNDVFPTLAGHRRPRTRQPPTKLRRPRPREPDYTEASSHDRFSRTTSHYPLEQATDVYPDRVAGA
jgi:hypothetical protein